MLTTSKEVKLITALIISIAINVGLVFHALRPVEVQTNTVLDKVRADNRKERNSLLESIVERDIRIKQSKATEDSLLALIPSEIETIRIIHEDAVSIPDTHLLNVVHDILAREESTRTSYNRRTTQSHCNKKRKGLLQRCLWRNARGLW